MVSIKSRQIILVWIFIVGIFLTLLLVAIQKMKGAFVFGIFSTISLYFFCRQTQLQNTVKLISDNRILTVPSSVVVTGNSADEKTTEETIVSTFGLILGNKVYKWGCDGIGGVRLYEVQIDREHVRLTFGTDRERLHVELLHSLTDSLTVFKIAKKFLHETGVQTQITDW